MKPISKCSCITTVILEIFYRGSVSLMPRLNEQKRFSIKDLEDDGAFSKPKIIGLVQRLLKTSEKSMMMGIYAV